MNKPQQNGEQPAPQVFPIHVNCVIQDGRLLVENIVLEHWPSDWLGVADILADSIKIAHRQHREVNAGEKPRVHLARQMPKGIN